MFGFNVLVVLIFGYILVGCIAYPYSNRIFSRSFRRQTNSRFGEEFIRCCLRIQRLINDMSETQTCENAGFILLSEIINLESTAQYNEERLSEHDDLRLADTPIQLSNKEIYLRISSNLELIGLYKKINE